MDFVNLSNARSPLDFENVSENWYARTHKLRDWIADNPDHFKKYKAEKLWAEMALRVLKLAGIYANANKPKATDYPKGGMPTVGETGPEIITVNGKTFRVKA